MASKAYAQIYPAKFILILTGTSDGSFNETIALNNDELWPDAMTPFLWAWGLGHMESK